MEINERLYTLRNSLNMSQEDFGKKIGVSRFAISNYETARRCLTERVITDVCREYNVSEEWLRNGEGPMLRPEKTMDNELVENIAKLIKTDDDLTKAFILELLKLNEEEMQVVKKILQNVKQYI